MKPKVTLLAVDLIYLAAGWEPLVISNPQLIHRRQNFPVVGKSHLQEHDFCLAINSPHISISCRSPSISSLSSSCWWSTGTILPATSLPWTTSTTCCPSPWGWSPSTRTPSSTSSWTTAWRATANGLESLILAQWSAHSHQLLTITITLLTIITWTGSSE